MLLGFSELEVEGSVALAQISKVSHGRKEQSTVTRVWKNII